MEILLSLLACFSLFKCYESRPPLPASQLAILLIQQKEKQVSNKEVRGATGNITRIEVLQHLVNCFNSNKCATDTRIQQSNNNTSNNPQQQETPAVEPTPPGDAGINNGGSIQNTLCCLVELTNPPPQQEQTPAVNTTLPRNATINGTIQIANDAANDQDKLQHTASLIVGAIFVPSLLVMYIFCSYVPDKIIDLLQ